MHSLLIVLWYECFLPFSSKRRYKRINRIHERSLRSILNDYESSFNSLFSTLNERMICQRCMNILLIEAYKYLHSYLPYLMNEIFIYAKTITSYIILMSLPLINPRNLLNFSVYQGNKHCVKKSAFSELFWSALFPHFSAFGLNTYSVQMRENARKMRTRITPNTDTFYSVKHW